MSTEAALKALSNSELASGTEIPATKHRNVNNAIIEELFDAQSRGDVLAGVQSGVLVSGDKVVIIRSGVAYLIDSGDFDFIDQLVDLTDVSVTSPLNDQVFCYDSETSKFTLKNLGDITTGGDITGIGTTNSIPKFTSGTSVGDSSIIDDGSTVYIAGVLNINVATGAHMTLKDTDETILTADTYITMIDSNNTLIGLVGMVSDDFRISATSSTFEIDLRTNNITRLRIGQNIVTSEIDFLINGDLDVNGDGYFSGTLNVNTGTVGGYKDASLGTNATALDVESVRELNVTAATYTASTTLTFSNVTNLKTVSMRITNTNANTLTFAGITVKFVSSELPSGLSFGSNALTFPADSAVNYNVVLFSFDGTTFRGKIELDG